MGRAFGMYRKLAPGMGISGTGDKFSTTCFIFVPALPV